MADAPKRIWVQFERTGAVRRDNEPDVKPVSSVIDQYTEYDIRREGQPISTDEFLSRLVRSDWWDDAMVKAINQWLRGDFTAAMEGLE